MRREDFGPSLLTFGHLCFIIEEGNNLREGIEMLHILGRLWREGYLTLTLCFIGRVAGLGTLALGLFCREHESGQYIMAGAVVLGVATLLRWMVTGFYDWMWDNIPALCAVERIWRNCGRRAKQDGEDR